MVLAGKALGKVIAVLSGKGGTGKTSVTAGLATALADMGHRVLCIDCDIGLRNLDISLGLAQAGTASFQEVCRGEYTLERAVRHPQYENLRFLTAPVNLQADSSFIENKRIFRTMYGKFVYLCGRFAE